LFIELDGSTHFEKSVRVKDKKKQTEIESLGFTLLRFKDEEVVNSLYEVREKIKNWISSYEKMHPEVLERKKRRRRR
jgi:very-short-patch-repair endonuclease